VLHVARWKCRTQKTTKNLPSGHPSHNFCWAISSKLSHISTIRKKTCSISSTCPHNMVNFSLLAAEILSLVWGTPANVNRFRVLVAFQHGTSSGHQPNFAALNRGCHLYSAGQPSRWALAHISSVRLLRPPVINIIMGM